MQRARFSEKEKDVVYHPGETLLRQGNRLAQRGRHNAARRQYGAIAELDLPYAGPLSLTNIAGSYRKEGDYGKARAAYRSMLEIEDLSVHYRFYALFNIAETYTGEDRPRQARETYSNILSEEELAQHYRMRALFGKGDSYRSEGNYTQARRIYSLIQEESELPPYPHEHYRTKAMERLRQVEGLADGQEFLTPRQRRVMWTEKPQTALYVATDGSDNNPGTRDLPFASMERARDEIRRINGENGLPEGGIAVYLRGGRYFRKSAFMLTEEDSGTPGSPVVYRSYPGEEVRIIGGRQVSGFKPVTDEKILARLPAASRGKVLQADLKAQDITDYGTLLPRQRENLAAMEVSYNGRIMTLARWPSDGWARVADLIQETAVMAPRNFLIDTKGRFIYGGDRPERWTEEPEVWLKGYWRNPYAIAHNRVVSIDTENKIISVEPRPSGIGRDWPYHAYNLLSELEMPGEWYVDRDSGILYFYPPGRLDESAEVLVSKTDDPLIMMDNASHVVIRGLTLEMTRNHGVEIMHGTNNLIAGCVIRNIGRSGVVIGHRLRKGSGGSNHTVVGCDIHDTGESGVEFVGGDIDTLTPGGHLVENCRIYRFNRFSGAYRPAVQFSGVIQGKRLGVGNRVAHNLIYDSPHQAIGLSGNDHIIEYNEIYDVLHEARENGALYIYDWRWSLLSRGHVIRYNMFHHMTEHSSPNKTHANRAIHIDALNAGLTILGNIFYRCSNAITTGGGREIRMENNIFADCASGIEIGNRVFLYTRSDLAKNRLIENLEAINYRQPPWSTRYPQLLGVLDEDPIGIPRDIVVTRNINIGPQFLRMAPGIARRNDIHDNFTEGDPLVRDIQNFDFRLRDGSPAYGEVGFQPLPVEKIGLYEDELRASWPVKREYGRYFREEEVVVLTLQRYTVDRRTAPVNIDGMLDAGEWHGLDKNRAMVINRDYRGRGEPSEVKSYAWVLYDDNYLYLGVMNEADRPKEPGIEDTPILEISIEGTKRPEDDWWMEDIPTGPIYVFWGRPDGTMQMMNIHKAPESLIEEIASKTEYAASLVDEESLKWNAEWKIPLREMGVIPDETETLRFNIGIRKRVGWQAWTPTGASITMLEYGGILRLSK